MESNRQAEAAEGTGESESREYQYQGAFQNATGYQAGKLRQQSTYHPCSHSNPQSFVGDRLGYHGRNMYE
jgi:hypothetical protein